MNPIHRAVIVVPAHNEARGIRACLGALEAAARCVTVPVSLLVVCDACDDGTADHCAAAGVPVVHIAARCVGAARRIGIATLIGHDVHPKQTWVATTDADSVVPVTWLRDQIALADADADAGVDAVAGVVSLTSPERPGMRRAFELHYGQRIASRGLHHHVHGANLGVRASAYLEVGGFAAVANHEDVLLVRALERRGHAIARPDWISVQTSGRLVGRCDRGFAHTLAHLPPTAPADAPALVPV